MGEKKESRKKPVQCNKKDGWQYMDILLKGILEHIFPQLFGH